MFNSYMWKCLKFAAKNIASTELQFITDRLPEVQLEMINPTRYFWQISSEVEVLGVDHLLICIYLIVIYRCMHYRPILVPIHLCLLVIVLPFFFFGGGVINRMVFLTVQLCSHGPFDKSQVVMISMPRRQAYRLPVL